MNFLEQWAITMVLGIISQTIKNQSLKAALESQLLGIASDVAATYGYQLVPISSGAIVPNCEGRECTAITVSLDPGGE